MSNPGDISYFSCDSNYMTPERREMFIQRLIKEYNITSNNLGMTYGEGSCLWCNKTYSKKMPTQGCCTRPCSKKWAKYQRKRKSA